MGVKLCERNHSTEGNTTKSKPNVQQGERVAGKGTAAVAVSASAVKCLSVTKRTRVQEGDLLCWQNASGNAGENGDLFSSKGCDNTREITSQSDHIATF